MNRDKDVRLWLLRGPAKFLLSGLLFTTFGGVFMHLLLKSGEALTPVILALPVIILLFGLVLFGIWIDMIRKNISADSNEIPAGHVFLVTGYLFSAIGGLMCAAELYSGFLPQEPVLKAVYFFSCLIFLIPGLFMLGVFILGRAVIRDAQRIQALEKKAGSIIGASVGGLVLLAMFIAGIASSALQRGEKRSVGIIVAGASLLFIIIFMFIVRRVLKDRS